MGASKGAEQGRREHADLRCQIRTLSPALPFPLTPSPFAMEYAAGGGG